MDKRIQKGVLAVRDWYDNESGPLVWEDIVRRILSATDSDQPARSFNLPDKPFALEIAAGERPTPGFVHHDARPLSDIEIVCDMGAELVEVLGESSASEIRACHVLEHSPYPEVVNLLLKWKSILVGGGCLYLEVPNLGWQIQACSAGEITVDEFVYYAYGEQNYPGNFHFNGFDETRLRNTLVEAQFGNITINNIGQVLIAYAYKV